MKNNKEQSERWLKQAEYDLKEAGRSLKSESFSYAAFFAEQSSQKSLKAFLMFKGERFINIHSIGELAKKCAEKDKIFSSLIDLGKILDRHYLASRYPDALPSPSIPAESYILKDAKEAISIAKKILEKVRKFIK